MKRDEPNDHGAMKRAASLPRPSFPFGEEEEDDDTSAESGHFASLLNMGMRKSGETPALAVDVDEGDAAASEVALPAYHEFSSRSDPAQNPGLLDLTAAPTAEEDPSGAEIDAIEDAVGWKEQEADDGPSQSASGSSHRTVDDVPVVGALSEELAGEEPAQPPETILRSDSEPQITAPGRGLEDDGAREWHGYEPALEPTGTETPESGTVPDGQAPFAPRHRLRAQIGTSPAPEEEQASPIVTLLQKVRRWLGR